MDIIVLAAALGPYAAVARQDVVCVTPRHACRARMSRMHARVRVSVRSLRVAVLRVCMHLCRSSHAQGLAHHRHIGARVGRGARLPRRRASAAAGGAGTRRRHRRTRGARCVIRATFRHRRSRSRSSSSSSGAGAAARQARGGACCARGAAWRGVGTAAGARVSRGHNDRGRRPHRVPKRRLRHGACAASSVCAAPLPRAPPSRGPYATTLAPPFVMPHAPPSFLFRACRCFR
jgi:hypothetical protein